MPPSDGWAGRRFPFPTIPSWKGQPFPRWRISSRRSGSSSTNGFRRDGWIMAEAVLMPKLGMTMDKGTILRWLKKEGEPVQAGEPLLEVMTDKINLEVESEISGTPLKVYYPEEVQDPVNRVVASMGEAREAVPQT